MTESKKQDSTETGTPPADKWTRRTILGTAGLVGTGLVFKHIYQDKIDDLMDENAQLRAAMADHTACQVATQYSAPQDAVRHDVFMLPSLPGRQTKELMVSPQSLRLLLADGKNYDHQYEKDAALHYVNLHNLDKKNADYMVTIDNAVESACREMHVSFVMQESKQPQRVHCNIQAGDKLLYVTVPANVQLLLDNLAEKQQAEALDEKNNTVHAGRNQRGEVQAQVTRVGNMVFLSANGPQCIKIKRGDGKYQAIPKAMNKEHLFGTNLDIEKLFNQPEAAQTRTL